MRTEKYSPSNGTEGDIFIAQWCNSCAFYKNEDDEYCETLGLTFALDVDDSDYPVEWTYDKNNQPCCTKYLHDSEKPIPRCSGTQDMFGN